MHPAPKNPLLHELHDLFEPLSGNAKKHPHPAPDTSKPRAEPLNESDLLK